MSSKKRKLTTPDQSHVIHRSHSNESLQSSAVVSGGATTSEENHSQNQSNSINDTHNAESNTKKDDNDKNKNSKFDNNGSWAERGDDDSWKKMEERHVESMLKVNTVSQETVSNAASDHSVSSNSSLHEDKPVEIVNSTSDKLDGAAASKKWGYSEGDAMKEMEQRYFESMNTVEERHQSINKSSSSCASSLSSQKSAKKMKKRSNDNSLKEGQNAVRPDIPISWDCDKNGLHQELDTRFCNSMKVVKTEELHSNDQDLSSTSSLTMDEVNGFKNVKAATNNGVHRNERNDFNDRSSSSSVKKERKEELRRLQSMLKLRDREINRLKENCIEYEKKYKKEKEHNYHRHRFYIEEWKNMEDLDKQRVKQIVELKLKIGDLSEEMEKVNKRHTAGIRALVNEKHVSDLEKQIREMKREHLLLEKKFQCYKRVHQSDKSKNVSLKLSLDEKNMENQRLREELKRARSGALASSLLQAKELEKEQIRVELERTRLQLQDYVLLMRH